LKPAFAPARITVADYWLLLLCVGWATAPAHQAQTPPFAGQIRKLPPPDV
jgi:hypothetical protein